MVAMSPSSLIISPTSSQWPTRTSSYMAAPAMAVAVTTANTNKVFNQYEFRISHFYIYIVAYIHMCWLTWSGDSMNVSKLALSLLVPDLGQLGHVHLHRFMSPTGGRAERRGIGWGNRELKGSRLTRGLQGKPCWSLSTTQPLCQLFNY